MFKYELKLCEWKLHSVNLDVFVHLNFMSGKRIGQDNYIFLIVSEAFKYQMRAYIYQARDLLAGDSNGLSGKYYK